MPSLSPLPGTALPRPLTKGPGTRFVFQLIGGAPAILLLQIAVAHAAQSGAAASPAQAGVPAAALTTVASWVPPGPAGLRRDAGTWLFNGWPVVEELPALALGPAGAAGSTPPSTRAPLFIPGLLRGEKRKLPVNYKLPPESGNVLRFRTLPLPPATELLAPGYDLAALQSRIKAHMAGGEGPFVGFSLPSRDQSKNALSSADLAALLPRLRTALQAVAPGAAVVYEVPVRDADLAARDVLAGGSLADAILLDYTGTESSLWPLKVARRLVEESDAFDLPLLVRLSPRRAAPLPGGRGVHEMLMHGATTVVLPQGSEVGLDWLKPAAPLLAGAVTLEDVGLLQTEESGTVAWDKALRAAGRLPLLGRLPRGAKAPAESIFIRLSASTTAAQLEDIKRTLGRGATLYLEGTPDLTRQELLTAMQDITGTLITVLDKPVDNVLILEDPWTFGTARKTELPVTQSVKVAERPSLAAQTRTQPGLDRMVTPRMVAKLPYDPGGVLAYNVGKGRVFWNPHPLVRTDTPGAGLFYSALAGAMQSALLKWSAKDERGASQSVEAAVRLSAGKTPLVALFNRGNSVASVPLMVRSAPALIYDVLGEKELKFQQRGYEATLSLDIPAGGWALLALPQDKKAWDKERKARK